MLLDADGVVSPAFHRRVVAGDHHLSARHPADARNDARARHLIMIKAVGSELAQFKERRSRIEQPLHTLARQQLAPRRVLGPRAFRTTLRGGGDLAMQFFRERSIMRRIGAKALPFRRELRIQNRRAHAPINSRPISMRRISLVPAPMSSSLASRI